jgi:hypothetical protein
LISEEEYFRRWHFNAECEECEIRSRPTGQAKDKATTRAATLDENSAMESSMGL